MKQAAMYVRVSTNKQKEEETIESQKSNLLQYAKEQGYEIPPQLVFEDNGVSGAILARPALDKLRDFAMEGSFSSLFVLSPDRLARKYAYQVVLLEEFKKNGVYVYFKSSPPSNSPGETLLEQMQGMFAEYERAQITERTRRGKNHKARNGCVNVLTKAPYGYRYICASASQQAYYEVIEREALVVRLIFDLYVKERLSISKIINYLYEHKVCSPKGNLKWAKSSLVGLLKSSTYRGIAYFGVRGKAEPDPMRLDSRRVRFNGRKTIRRSCRERPSSEWIPIPVPPIISEEIFNLAEELRKKNRIRSTRDTKSGSLLQGLICCKECGYGFTLQRSGKKSNENVYYRCNNLGEVRCKNRGIRVVELDKAIWDSLINLLNSPELIQEEITRRLSELKREPIMEKQKQLKKQLMKLELESNRLLDAYQEGCLNILELKSRMEMIKKEIQCIKRALTEEASGLTPEKLLELKIAVEYFSSRLKTAQKDLSIEEKRKLLRILIKEIQIGTSDVTINHIFPFNRNESQENAQLSSYHSDVECSHVVPK